MKELALILVAALVGCGGDADRGEAKQADRRDPDQAVAAGEAEDAAEVTQAVDAAAASRRITLVAVGDLMLGRYFLDKSYHRVPRVDRPFADVRSVLEGADLAIGNLENPIVAEPDDFHVTPGPGRDPADDGPSLTFRAEPSDAALLAGAGFTTLSLANNHARDLGPVATVESRRILEAAGIGVAGVGATLAEAQAPVIVEEHGLRVAFVAWTVWLKGLDGVTEESAVATIGNREIESLADEVARVKAAHAADFLVLSIHWGWEYQPRADHSQRRAARAFVDAGADLVLGHHPHVVQDFELYHGGVIAYSLGNFLFDTGGLEQRRSVILAATLDGTDGGRRVTDVALRPAMIVPGSHAVELARGARYAAWRRDLEERAPGFAIAAEPSPRAEDPRGDRATGAAAAARTRRPERRPTPRR